MEITDEWLVRMEKPESLLEKELERFSRFKQVWLAMGWEGQWIMIHCGEETYQFIFSTFDGALEKGYEVAGLKPFLVKQILTEEKVYRM